MDIPLIVFAKAPIAGKVKTRLQPNCSALQAAEIAKLLLDECLANVSAIWPGPLLLSVALDHQNPFILKMATKYNALVLQQSAGDLGEKMHSCFEQYGYPAAIIGSDAPHISESALLQAHEILSCHKNVVGPSVDGGYYLIGLSSPSPCLFKGISWGESTVLESTLIVAMRNLIKLEKLAHLNDIDTWPDLLQAARQLPSIQTYLQKQSLV